MRRKIDGDRVYYHLMSRTVGGRALLGVRCREVLRKMIWQVAEFSGVRVVTYAIMKNHFHVLVEVPGGVDVSDSEIVRRFRRLYPKPTPWQPLSPRQVKKLLSVNGQEGQELRRKLLSRMHDVSWLMRTIKQRFTRWYNQTEESFGTVWAERFKSVLVEGSPFALRTVAAYIDLNAVRAGLVEDPKDYRFCGYGEAMGGGRSARAGLRIADPKLSGYRQTLYGAGSGEKSGKISISREDAVRVLEIERGKLPLPVVLRCRVRYFSEGIAIGSPQFVELCRNAEHGVHPKNKPKVHPMEGADWDGLSVGAGLRTNLFG